MRGKFMILLISLAVADRLTKAMALSGVQAKFWIAHFVLVKNPNLVFSLPMSNTVAVLVMLVGIGIILWIGWRSAGQGNVTTAMSIALIFLGAMSNLFDRIRFGFVIDWAYFGRWWPVFNVADVMVAAGVILIVLRQASVSQKA